MFTELPKLLDRNHVVGFLLPAAVLCGLGWWMLAGFGLVEPPAAPEAGEALLGGTFALIGVWLASILLLALNAQADRLLQGYGWTRPGLSITREKTKFKRDALPLLQSQTEIDEGRKAGRVVIAPADFPLRLSKAIARYPDSLAWLLPTRYGNRIRAAEVYSRVVYGLEAVTASYRISWLLPAEFRELLSGARAQLDFCISLVVGGALALILFLGLALYQACLPSLWPAAAAAAMIGLGYALAVELALPYGNYLRAAFDLGRQPLAERLGLAIPADPAEETKMWEAVGQMFTFRSRADFEALAKFRKAPAAAAPAAPGGGAGPAQAVAGGPAAEPAKDG